MKGSKPTSYIKLTYPLLSNISKSQSVVARECIKEKKVAHLTDYQANKALMIAAQGNAELFRRKSEAGQALATRKKKGAI